MTRMALVLLLSVAVPALLLAAGGAARAEAALPRQNLSRATPAQWAAAFATLGKLPLAARLACWADLAAVDCRYAADPLGEGPGHPPDPDPRCDYARADCVTFLEQALALALSPDAAAVPSTLQRLRYRDGQVDYRWRNHFFVSDWLPANAWCVRDVTAEVGGDRVRTMRKTIARGAFFAGKGLPQYADLPDEAAETAFLPRDAVPAVLDRLRAGDLAIFVVDTPGIIAGHTGLLRRRDDGTVCLQHASLTATAVVTVPLRAYLRDAPARFVGLKIARPFDPAAPK